MLKTAVAHSEDTIVSKAVDEVLDQIKAELGDVEPQAGILFCSPDLEHPYILSRLRAAYPAIELIGCSADGELSSPGGLSEDAIVLMVIASDCLEIRAGAGKDLSGGGIDAGREAAGGASSAMRLNRGENRFGLIISDPLNAGVSEVSNGIAEVLGEAFPLFGGASSAHSKRRTTYQFCNGEILTDSVVLLLVSGPVLFSFGIKGGHSAIGGRDKITSSSRNVLYTIGDKTALDYFRGYIGDNYDLFMNYCIAIFEEGRESFYVRSAPFCDPEAGTVTLNGVVSEGASLQIGTADKSACSESCLTSLRMARASYPGKKPAAALLFSCAGRKKMLGTQADIEAQITAEQLGPIPFAGFYAYGEISPLDSGSKAIFHGTTFVTLLLGEE